MTEARLRFWGTRGSVPSPGPHTVRYGGNTPCVEASSSEGGLVIFDAGTGIRSLGDDLRRRAGGAPIRGDIFLTHAHWDHIQGIPFFAPLYDRGNHFTIWASQALATDIEQVLRDQMAPAVFPVRFEELRATIEFRRLADGEQVKRGGFTVTTMEVQHPGGALAYRFTDSRNAAAACVYAPDNELGAAGAQPNTPAGWRERITEFCRGASVLAHDTTYTTEEYAAHGGWGHSTFRDAVDLALAARVCTLALFHHEPRRSDDDLERQAEQCRTQVQDRGGNVHVLLAAEGLSVPL